MKQFFVLLMVVGSCKSYAQWADKNTYSIAPNIYNSFTNNPNISWAAHFDFSYSFLNCPYKKYPGIYDYLIDNQKKGIIKSYKINECNNCGDDSIVDNRKLEHQLFYSEINYPQQNDNGIDSLKEIYFDQTLAIEKHHLKSYITAAGPEFEVSNSLGMLLGISYQALCSINRSKITKDKKDVITFLKTTDVFYNEDSLAYSNITNIKTTYGMNLVTTLWYDLSKGYNKIVDLKTNKIINPLYVWNYPIDGFIQVPQYDSVGNNIGFSLRNGPAARSYISKIAIRQEWYYNSTKNIFFNKIKEADVYTSTALNRIEKRFTITFQ